MKHNNAQKLELISNYVIGHDVRFPVQGLQALSVISMAGSVGITSTALCDRLGSKVSTISSLLKLLSSDGHPNKGGFGFVRWIHDVEDRRCKYAVITSRGAEFLRHIEKYIEGA